MRYIRNPDMRQLVQDYVQNKGWSLVRTHANHVKLIPPHGGPFVIVGCSKSIDPTAVHNIRARLRRIEEGAL